jgi:K+-transporting ATPase KdpF subunit
MKSFLTSASIAPQLSELWFEFRRQKLPRSLFLLLCCNLILAPAVQAAEGDISRTQSYALGILILATIALSAYLFVVMFQPERF